MVQLEELEAWFQERPKWMQDTAQRLIHNGTLTEQDFTDLLATCVAEANGQTVQFSGLPAGALGVQDATMPLRLESISDVQGINALCPNKPLTFGNTPLCIVYGRNGSGKSGYVRLLKHACGARSPGELLADIFKTGAQPQAARVTFTENTQNKTSTWTGQSLAELRGVDIYDTACGLVYVDQENEVAFEPWLLRFFTELTKVCETLSQRIQAQIVANVSKKPVFPPEYVKTLEATWYNAITASTPPDDVEKRTNWALDHETESAETNKRLAETNPAAKAAILRRQNTATAELLAYLKGLYNCFSLKECEGYLRAKTDAWTKRTAADQDAKKVFEKAPLSGIGSESWRLLWEAARKYSTEHAYSTAPFPNVSNDARCVLCQQVLDLESRDRFRSFENFVKGELQRQAIQAEQTLQTIEVAFPDIRTAEALTLRMDAAGITDANLRAMVADFSAVLAKRRQTCLSAGTIEEVAGLPVCDVWTLLEALSAEVEKRAVACDEDAKGQNRPQLEARVKELSARRWLNQQRQAIDTEIARLALVKRLQAARTLTSTTALSKRKSILAEDLITNVYIQRFKDQLKALKADGLRVELKKTRAEVGRVYHQLTLRNAARTAKTSDILSEGEFRIVSLASFLADTEGRGAKTPFIFDDPISSLDQVYEEATAQRLVALSKTRQVIVFTHRLSLVGLLEKYTEKETVGETIVCLSRVRTGDIAELPITLTKTKPTANRFLNERFKALKGAYQAGDAEYEKEAKALCRDIRILIEQIVEADLLAGVVRRYNPEVQTKGRIEYLAKITPDDCKFVDDMMTTYSRYEHSQPEEAPIELPKPNEIESDLKKIVEFIERVQSRRKA